MPTLTPTKDKGAASKAIGALYVEPEQVITDDMLASLFADTGLNGAFVADMLSAMLTHERCGRHLYRSVEGRTNNPVLRAKYKEFGEETERHVAILEDLITQIGGNPNYVSPTARAVEGADARILESTFALAGSIVGRSCALGDVLVAGAATSRGPDADVVRRRCGPGRRRRRRTPRLGEGHETEADDAASPQFDHGQDRRKGRGDGRSHQGVVRGVTRGVVCLLSSP
jgi:hypothetical protein